MTSDCRQTKIDDNEDSQIFNEMKNNLSAASSRMILLLISMASNELIKRHIIELNKDAPAVQ